MLTDSSKVDNDVVFTISLSTIWLCLLESAGAVLSLSTLVPRANAVDTNH